MKKITLANIAINTVLTSRTNSGKIGGLINGVMQGGCDGLHRYELKPRTKFGVVTTLAMLNGLQWGMNARNGVPLAKTQAVLNVIYLTTAVAK